MKHRMTRWLRPMGLGVLLLGVMAWSATQARAGLVFSQGFETDTSGWFAGDQGGYDYGTITQVPSGTGSITSASGSFHAVVTDTSIGSDASAGPFTRFGGYSGTWPGGFTTSLDIYLDTSWSPGEGFDYSSSVSNSSGGFLRDFIFHVAQDTSTGQLLVGASNNSSDSTTDESIESGDHYTVTGSGWYTFQAVYRDDGGALAVDMNLINQSSGMTLWTDTIHSGDLISNVGGNRYGWFTLVNVSGGVAIDNTLLTAVPEPSTLAMSLSAALFGLVGVARRGRKRLAA